MKLNAFFYLLALYTFNVFYDCLLLQVLVFISIVISYLLFLILIYVDLWGVQKYLPKKSLGLGFGLLANQSEI